jgi:hypothetical protein
MIRIILAWVILSALIAFLITMFRSLSGKQKWQLTKIVSYATMCSLIAVAILVGITVIF